MKKNKYKCVVFDLDGTLLNFRMKISRFSRKVLLDLIERGIRCVIISSRTLTDIERIVQDIPFSCIASLNGSVISCSDAKKSITDNIISKKSIYEIIDDEKISGFTKNYYGKDHVFVNNFSRNIFVRFYQKKLRSILINDDFYKTDIFQIDVFIDKRKRYDELFRYMENKYKKFLSIKNAGYNFIVMNNKNVDKGYALQEVCKKLKVKMNETIVVGDSLADISMFNKDCYKIAMKNGNQKIFCKADKISSSSNDKDGAVKEVLSVINSESENKN